MWCAEIISGGRSEEPRRSLRRPMEMNRAPWVCRADSWTVKCGFLGSTVRMPLRSNHRHLCERRQSERDLNTHKSVRLLRRGNVGNRLREKIAFGPTPSSAHGSLRA